MKLPLIIEISGNKLTITDKKKKLSYNIERMNIDKGKIKPPSATYNDLVKYGLNSDPYGKILKGSHPVHRDISLGGPAPRGIWNGFIKIRKTGEERIELTELKPRKYVSKSDGCITSPAGTPRSNIQIHPYTPVRGCIRFPKGKDKEFRKLLQRLKNEMKKGRKLVIAILDDFWETRVGKKVSSQ